MPSLPARVGLFIAGVQKGGTTSLHGYFTEHPRLLAGTTKELHFFDDESLDWWRPDYTPLHRQFVEREPTRLRFDATPIYIFWPPSLERLRRYNAAAKLVLLFRDPVERAYSHWRMERARHAETLSFSEAIRAGRARLPDDRCAPAWRIYSYVERGLYGAQVARALSLFPREQLLFLRSSDLRRSHRRTLHDISRFVGIEPFPAGPPKELQPIPVQERPQETISPEDRRYLVELFHEDTRHFAELSGLDVSDWQT